MAPVTAVKVVVVGDPEVDKASLLACGSAAARAANDAPGRAEGTSDNRLFLIVNDDGEAKAGGCLGRAIELSLCDTTGQEENGALRPASYSGTDVVVIFFSLIKRQTFESVRRKWLAEAEYHCPSAAKVLVGVHRNLRDDSSSAARYVNEREGREMACKIGAARYLEATDQDPESMALVFEAAALAGAHASTIASQSGSWAQRKLPLLRPRAGGRPLPPALAENRMALQRVRQAMRTRHLGRLDAAIRDARALIDASEATAGVMALLASAESQLTSLTTELAAAAAGKAPRASDSWRGQRVPLMRRRRQELQKRSSGLALQKRSGGPALQRRSSGQGLQRRSSAPVQLSCGSPPRARVAPRSGSSLTLSHGLPDLLAE